MTIVNKKEFNKEKGKIERSDLLLCPECNTKMKRFLKSACLECPKCNEVFHIEVLVNPKEDEIVFQSEENALRFVEELFRNV